MKQVFIDVETTGVNHWQHAVHQISGGIYINDKLVESFDFKVKPHERAKVEQGALDVGGLTLDTIVAYPHRTEVYPKLIALLEKNCKKFDSKDKYFFCAYNAHFDNAFVRAFFKQCDDNYFGSWFWSNNIDVMVLAGEYLKDVRHEMENFKLMTVAKKLGIEIDESKLHDGFYDIELTKKVYDIITKK
jgi:DNA polymerase-3 subunit epsilon